MRVTCIGFEGLIRNVSDIIVRGYAGVYLANIISVQSKIAHEAIESLHGQDANEDDQSDVARARCMHIAHLYVCM